ncbi:MAG: SPFH domain-containing protein, partial [Clostridiales bacterium]|nr:SPFH domain-containing protein [Clostridiales bacterium]
EIRPNAIPGHAEELSQAMNEALTKKWSELRGLAVVSIAMNPITLPEEDAELIKQAQRTAIMRDPTMAAATLVGAQADAMKAAAANEGGAMMGFMGLGMAQQAGNAANTQGLYQIGAQQQAAAAQSTQTPANAWKCSCGAIATGNFCPECGTKKPDAPAGWTCSCGSVNKGKFCSNCGNKKPPEEPLYKCDKCGWEPEDPRNPPKFCPECGDPFNEDDIR